MTMNEWRTFTLSVIILVGAIVGFLMGKLDAETLQWAIAFSMGGYTARTVAAKVTGQ
jgi:hypothetical protein